MLGVHVPVYPIQGYTTTVPLRPDAPTLSNSVMNSRTTAFAPLSDGRIRVSSMGDFAGWKEVPVPSRIDLLRQEVKLALTPKLVDPKYINDSEVLIGSRPVT